VGPLSAVREGVRPYTASLVIPAGRPYSCRGSLCYAGFPWEAECDGFAGEPAGRPPSPTTSLGKPTSGVGTPSSKLSLPDNPQHLIQVARVKGCLNNIVKTPTYKSLQRESSLQKFIWDYFATKRITILQRKSLHAIMYKLLQREFSLHRLIDMNSHRPTLSTK
jgi:hypothetical protein